MASLFINNWINRTQNLIDYWFNNYPLAPNRFSISPTPGLPLIDSNILNHNLTSSCPTPPFPSISFEHFPEPYYGNPDDEFKKVAVVLFYNPGPQDELQHILSRGEGTFFDNYRLNDFNYSSLSRNLNFCLNTINSFWSPKTKQLSNLLSFLTYNKNDFQPFFMDLIPWHSKNFNGVDSDRFTLSNTLLELKLNVIIPAILNAKNSLVTDYLNKTLEGKRKIVLFAVGAKYSNQNYLQYCGFDDISTSIPQMLPHVSLVNNVIQAGWPSKRLKIWKLNDNRFFSNILIENQDQELGLDLEKDDVYIVNIWNTNVGMNIPQGISDSMKHILDSL